MLNKWDQRIVSVELGRQRNDLRLIMEEKAKKNISGRPLDEIQGKSIFE